MELHDCRYVKFNLRMSSCVRLGNFVRLGNLHTNRGTGITEANLFHEIKT